MATGRPLERRLTTTRAAILCGGASRRMGRDKALLPIEGTALASRVAQQCRVAGCETVVAVGGDQSGLTAAGLVVVADDTPDEGPLGAIITALRRVSDDCIVFVVSVDLPGVAAAGIARTIDTLRQAPQADMAVPVSASGRRHHLHAAWRPRARTVLEDAFETGERAVKRALTGLAVVEVGGVDEQSLFDVDTPEDLRDWMRNHGSSGPER